MWSGAVMWGPVGSGMAQLGPVGSWWISSGQDKPIKESWLISSFAECGCFGGI